MELVTESYPYWKALLWCFYLMASLVAIELFLRSVNEDDDDDGSDGGLMTPVFAPSAS